MGALKPWAVRGAAACFVGPVWLAVRWRPKSSLSRERPSRSREADAQSTQLSVPVILSLCRSLGRDRPIRHRERSEATRVARG